MNAFRHQSLFAIFAVAASLSLSACIPYHYVGAPAVTGQVVSRTTTQPIADAAVSMTDLGGDSVHSQTDVAGRFHLPAVQHWMFVPLLSDGFNPPVGTLRVDAPLHHSYFEQVPLESVPPQGYPPQQLRVALP